jgi:hypothetical protein
LVVPSGYVRDGSSGFLSAATPGAKTTDPKGETGLSTPTTFVESGVIAWVAAAAGAVGDPSAGGAAVAAGSALGVVGLTTWLTAGLSTEVGTAVAGVLSGEAGAELTTGLGAALGTASVGALGTTVETAPAGVAVASGVAVTTIAWMVGVGGTGVAVTTITCMVGVGGTGVAVTMITSIVGEGARVAAGAEVGIQVKMGY